MEKYSTYEEVQQYISMSKKKYTYNMLRKLLAENQHLVEKYQKDGFLIDDLLFAIKQNIPLQHHYCPVCGNEIHVYSLQRYPNTCSVSCGVLNSQQLRKQNSLKKYGVESPQSLATCKAKVKKTMKKRYGGYTFQSKELMEKVKKTNIQRYGVEISAANKDIHKKNVKTCLEKYGVTHTSKLPENRAKAKRTNLELHGSENWNNLDKIKKTCLERYGVENPTQCHDIRIKEQKRYFYDNKNFDSSWELAIYIWHKDKNIEFEYQPNIIFYYEYNGKTHTYHPDFLIGGKIYEIKGDQYFNSDFTAMICPYNHKLDDLYNAKYKCMLKNNVIIWRSNDVKKYLDYIYQKYDIMYLQKFRKH